MRELYRASPPEDGPSLVLVADSARARVFEANEPDAPLRELAGLANPVARLHEGDIVEDHGGRRNHRPTQAKRSALGGDSAKRHRAEEFAATVCELTTGTLRDTGAQRLYIVADPEFLGLIRRRLGRTTRRRVSGEVPKSLTSKGPAEIRAVLPRRL